MNLVPHIPALRRGIPYESLDNILEILYQRRAIERNNSPLQRLNISPDNLV